MQENSIVRGMGMVLLLCSFSSVQAEVYTPALTSMAESPRGQYEQISDGYYSEDEDSEASLAHEVVLAEGSVDVASNGISPEAYNAMVREIRALASSEPQSMVMRKPCMAYFIETLQIIMNMTSVAAQVYMFKLMYDEAIFRQQAGIAQTILAWVPGIAGYFAS